MQKYNKFCTYTNRVIWLFFFLLRDQRKTMYYWTMYEVLFIWLFGHFDTNGTRALSGEGLGILGNLGKLEELGGIIGYVFFVPNAENVENSLSGEGLGNLGILGVLGIF